MVSQFAVVFLVMGLPILGYAQTSTSADATIERVVVQSAIERAGLKGMGPFRVMIDPMMVYAGQAPGFTDLRLRDSTRHAMLLRSLGATSRSRPEVMRCSTPPCLQDVDVFVTLSPPEVAGDSSSITVTTLRYRPRAQSAQTRKQYITTSFVLRRDGKEWRIVRADVLGVS